LLEPPSHETSANINFSMTSYCYSSDCKVYLVKCTLWLSLRLKGIEKELNGEIDL